MHVEIHPYAYILFPFTIYKIRHLNVKIMFTTALLKLEVIPATNIGTFSDYKIVIQCVFSGASLSRNISQVYSNEGYDSCKFAHQWLTLYPTNSSDMRN